MKNHKNISFHLSFKIAALVLLMMGTANFTSFAQDVRVYRFTNNTGQAASDLHAIYRGTGGSLETEVIDMPKGCPRPVISSNGQVSNRMDVDFQRNCIPVGATVTVRVKSDNFAFFDSGYWTGVGHQEEPGIGRMDPDRDVEELEDEGSKPNKGDKGEKPGKKEYPKEKWDKDEKGKNSGKQDGNGKEKPIQDKGDNDEEESSPFDDTIFELESKRDLLERVKKGKNDDQKKEIDEAIKKLNEAIDGLKKMRDNDPKAPSEGEIEKAIRDAADAVDRANPGNTNLTLKRIAECLRDIARNLF